MARITVDMITDKEFNLENRGYNRQEVDNFLDDICEEMERMEAEIKELQQKTTYVKPAAPAGGSVSMDDANSFKEILDMAQKVKEETIQKAREDAEAIRAKAETEARERLDGLSEEQNAMKRQLEDLKAAAAAYRRSFEELLQAQQEAIEKASDLF